MNEGGGPDFALAGRSDFLQLPGGERLGPSLDHQGHERPQRGNVPHGEHGTLPDQDLARRGVLVEARRQISYLAGDEEVPLRRLPIGDDLTRIDAGADLRQHAGGALRPDPCANGRRAAGGALGVILVNHRQPEDRYHRVADELLHRAAVPFDLLPGDVEQPAHLPAEAFRGDAPGQYR